MESDKKPYIKHNLKEALTADRHESAFYRSLNVATKHCLCCSDLIYL
jgi:hypothetical protein